MIFFFLHVYTSAYLDKSGFPHSKRDVDLTGNGLRDHAVKGPTKDGPTAL